MEHETLPVLETFTKWKDFTQFIEAQGIGKTYSGVGIFHNSLSNTILRSVDGTPYYLDESNMYTLFGQIGNQNLNDKYNAPFLNKGVAYLYRVTKKNNKNIWLWYGLVKVIGEPEEIEHVDRNGNMRIIYRVKLLGSSRN